MSIVQAASLHKMPRKTCIWDFFEMTDTTHAKCNACKKELAAKAGATSGLINHLKGQHCHVFLGYKKLNYAQQIGKKSRVIDDEDSSETNFISTPKRARLVASPESYSQFLTSSASNKGKENPVSSKSLSQDRIPKLYKFISDHVNKIIDSEKIDLDGCAYITDIWTSCNDLAFQLLTLHFTTKCFQLKQLLVKLDSFPDAHNAENIVKKLDYLIKRLCLENKINTWGTTDGGSNIMKAMRISNVINNNLWCADYQIHLIVTQALASVPEWLEVALKLNKLVGYFSHSSKATSILRKIAIEHKQSRTKLIQKVPTRWNSDLRQLKSIMDLKGCLSFMAETSTKIEDLLPTVVEANIIKGIIECLDPIDKISSFKL
ncbi:uncharacterized protein LOC101235945 [Hydra vulgaris]|uniref:uncharacterized protein LOC101235945 n=1 Tax=Hydra vulgaris TaxID=6087 RepID=UPI001F5F6F09|nr:uncharacterized protein LOC101235945 [Hydra vulgaris]